MKTLVIAHGHPGIYPGGSEIVAHGLFEQLNAVPGNEAYFLACTRAEDGLVHGGTPFASYDGSPRESLLLLQAGFDHFTLSQPQLGMLTAEFPKFLQAIRPDVVHFQHFINIGVEAIRVVRQTLPGAAIVATLHEFVSICNREGQMVRTFDDSLCDRASAVRCHQCYPAIAATEFTLRESYIKSHLAQVDRFVCPSRFLLERYVAWGLPRAKMVYVDNGHPLANTEVADGAPGNPVPVFAYFGQINRYKGTALLLEAAEILLGRGFTDFQIRIHGTLRRQEQSFVDEFQRNLTRLKRRPNYAGQVQFAGPYEPAQAVGLMSGADYVVMTSRWWENAPLVIQEAFTARRPVLCSDVGGMAEKVRNGVDGIHFRLGDPVALAAAIQKCAADPSLWQTMHVNIRRAHTTRESAREHLALYGDVLRERGTAVPAPVAQVVAS